MRQHTLKNKLVRVGLERDKHLLVPFALLSFVHLVNRPPGAALHSGNGYAWLLRVSPSNGSFIVSLGNTLWLDPLVERAHLMSINMTTNVSNVRMELLKERYAAENKQVRSSKAVLSCCAVWFVI